MIPVFQTRRGPLGNCYAACVASILEKPLDEVPDIRGKDWGRRFSQWFDSQGIGSKFLQGNNLPLSEQTFLPPGWSILACRGSGPIHAVVCRDGVIVHDPSGGNVQPDSLVMLWTVFDLPCS
jgi:hypothetical protein